MAAAAFDFAHWFSPLLFLLAAATLTWLMSLPLKNVTLADSLWSLLIFMAGVIYALGADPRAPRLAMVLWLLALWAIRLATHVTLRNAGRGEDPRHRALRDRHEPGFAVKSLYLVFWRQALLAWVISLPILGAFSSLNPRGWLDVLGVVLWAMGFGIEVIADWQLRRFRKDPAHAGQVFDRGLWRLARHPNYFGEACLWWGFGLIAMAAGAWWALAAPLLLTLLLWRVAAPRLETHLGTRLPRYADYVLKTQAFIPGMPRK